MAVFEPLKIQIMNWNDSFPKVVTVPDFPNDPTKSSATHSVPFDSVIYIDRDDFREVKHVKFFILTCFFECKKFCCRMPIKITNVLLVTKVLD